MGSDSRGLTLVELLVAVVLLLVGILGTVTMQNMAVRTNQASFSTEVAASLARQLLETSRRVDYDDTRLDDTSGAFVVPDASLLAPAPPQFTREWTITDNNPAQQPDQEVTKTIQARVSWTQGSRGAEQIVLTTVRAW